jgi:hypothetical protein
VLTTASAASTLLELDDSDRLDVLLVEIEAFTRLRIVSTEDELPESCVDDTLIADSATSTLEEELERLRLEVWLVEMRAFVAFNAASTLLDEEETC